MLIFEQIWQRWKVLFDYIAAIIHEFKIIVSFADVNECADNVTNECDHNAALCTNNEGSYDCSCLSGYVGDGKNCSGTLTFFIETQPITQSFK